MNDNRRILLSKASVATSRKTEQGTLLIEGEHIAGVWFADSKGQAEYNGSKMDLSELEGLLCSDYPDTEKVDLQGKTIMAGAIDAHVHFREPGMTQKADMHTESKAALLGGVTSYIDMPNTNPPAVSIERIEEKCSLAAGRSFANYGFHIGADNRNPEKLNGYISSGESNAFGGIKVFMGSSTGNMLVDRGQALDELFRIKGKAILIHSEDEGIIKANLEKAESRFGDNIPFSEHENIRSRTACIRSTAKALEMAMKYGTRLHILHVSTAEEVEMIRTAKNYNPDITAETSANYLWFCDEDYSRLEGMVKCNPAIKTARDREALRKALKEGIIDTIGSDHAPHLAAEKKRPYLTCPSGLPSIQQALSVILTIAHQENIPMSRIASVLSERASEILGIRGRGKIEAGAIADLIIIDPEKEFTVGQSDSGAAGIAYKCGWSPYEGTKLKGLVEDVYLNGSLVVHNGKLMEDRPQGKRLEFMPV